MTQSIRDRVRAIVRDHPVVDMHTHLFAPVFDRIADDGRFLLSGIDELLNYHYLSAELFRAHPDLSPDAYFAMAPRDRADLVWRALFVDRVPVSESCRGILSILMALGLDPNETTLGGYRSWFAARDADAHVDRVMALAGVERITMTNELFDRREVDLWLGHASELRSDPRFDSVARIDPLLIDPRTAADHLSSLGHDVSDMADVRRFLVDWIERTGAVYVAASLPPTWRYRGGPSERVFKEALFPALRDTGLPLALMIGVTRGVNPELQMAGDGSGIADVKNLWGLAQDAHATKLLVTMLSDQNQHELCVAARKFPNIVPFGCWWFLNTPTSIAQITRLRLELLGSTFVPQHSDARVLEQLIYKWSHSRDIIAGVLSEHFGSIEESGRPLTDAEITNEVDLMLRRNYERAIVPKEQSISRS
ncbi:MAG: glucuronate isomerase [Planctomycetota bacterium]